VEACPSCGQRNPATARYCSACGTRLTDGARTAEERKIVSVLFVDLVGFTARSDRADPEDVRDLLQLYHSRVKEQAERFSGTVEKFIGDAVVAVFGAPATHTDDPERAVRAGLRALAAVQELNRSRPDLDLVARAAVNTGEAVVATGARHQDGEALAMGDVVNTASRLQAAAPPGRLIVGEETYRATHDGIRYEAIGAVETKGKKEPVKAWLAVEPIAPGERRSGGGRLVGRERELALLRSVWESSAKENRPHLVTVIGPPGIGKSRLSREFASLVQAGGGRSIRGRCLPYDTRDVYGAFAEQGKDVAQIFEQDPPAKARAKLAAAVVRLFPVAERQEVTRCLSLMLGLGVDPPVDEQLLLLFSARRLVERLGREQPTLLIFEDIHWADAGQLDLIAYLAAHVRETPVLLLALARPELLDDRPGWGTGLHATTSIGLDPVSPADSAALVGQLTGAEVPAPALGRLVEVAGGNPLFLEELAAGWMEDPDRSAELPTTVRAAIAARVDALPPEQRSALLAASVVGKVFWRGALQAAGTVDSIDRSLDALEARDFVRREATSRVQGDVEFSFRHALIRDVCYSTLPRAQRRSAHESVARYIEQVSGGQDRELAWLLSHHWQEAGDLVRAVGYLLLAAERAEEARAEKETIELLQRALRLVTEVGERSRVGLKLALARVRFEDFEQGAVELETLIPQLEGANLLEALLALGRCYHWTERTAQTLEVAGRTLDLAEELGASEFVAPALARLSQGHAMRGETGDLDRALELGERALRLWVPGKRLADMAEHEHLLADQHYWTANYERALELSSASREQAVDPSSAEALLRGGGMEGMLLSAMGRYEEALASFDRVLALGREMGRPVRVLLNYSTLAFRDLFDLEEARRRSEESLSQAVGNPAFHMPRMNAAVDLLQTNLLAGDVGAASLGWRELWEPVMATSAWERWYLGGKLAAARAEIALATESPEAAAEWAQKAVEMALSVRRAKYEAVARATLGKALQALGSGDRAREEMRAAIRIADRLGTPALRWRFRGDLAALLYAGGDDGGAEVLFGEAGAIIREVEAGLAPSRAKRFVAAPQVAELLKTARA